VYEKWLWTWIPGPMCSIARVTFGRVACMIACPMVAAFDAFPTSNSFSTILNTWHKKQSY